MHFTRRLFLIAGISLAGAMGGCATPKLTAPQGSEGKTWVAVSTMGNSARFQHVGTMVFNNIKTEIDTASWGLDDFIEISARNRRPNLKWKQIAITQELRSGLSSVGDTDLFSAFSAASRKSNIEMLKEKCQCDFALIVAPVFFGDSISETNASLRGYGVHQRGTLVSDNRTYTFLSAGITLLDMHTGKEISSVSSSRSDRLPFNLDKDKNLQPSQDEFKHIENSIKTLANTIMSYNLSTLPER